MEQYGCVVHCMILVEEKKMDTLEFRFRILKYYCTLHCIAQAERTRMELPP